MVLLWVVAVINSVIYFVPRILKTVAWKHNIFNILHLLSGIDTQSGKVCEVSSSCSISMGRGKVPKIYMGRHFENQLVTQAREWVKLYFP